jgi:hypothetical protein
MPSRPECNRGPKTSGTVLTFGTIRTGLLLSSGAISQDALVDTLRLLPGEHVRTSERPIAYGVSAEVLTGIDCSLTGASGARTRGVGTVATRAMITGGRVVQGSTYAGLVESEVGYRRPWSHFLGEPGTLEILNKIAWEDLAQGLMHRQRRPDINLDAICDRVLDQVQRSPRLDRSPPFKAARTTLRWILKEDRNSNSDHLSFTVVNNELRIVELTLTDHSLPAVLHLCEDLALHDWLLTTLLAMIERSTIGSGEQSYILAKLRPAVDHLLHLWMPGVRVDSRLIPLWHGLDKRPGFTTQWEVSVNRIRDQLTLGTLILLGAVAEGKAGVHEQGAAR